MGTEKLDHTLEQVDIKQTRSNIDPIRFKDEAINKVRKDYCDRAIENKKQEDLIQLYETALSKVGDKNE